MIEHESTINLFFERAMATANKRSKSHCLISPRPSPDSNGRTGGAKRSERRTLFRSFVRSSGSFFPVLPDSPRSLVSGIQNQFSSPSFCSVVSSAPPLNSLFIGNKFQEDSDLITAVQWMHNKVDLAALAVLDLFGLMRKWGWPRAFDGLGMLGSCCRCSNGSRTKEQMKEARLWDNVPWAFMSPYQSSPLSTSDHTWCLNGDINCRVICIWAIRFTIYPIHSLLRLRTNSFDTVTKWREVEHGKKREVICP